MHHDGKTQQESWCLASDWESWTQKHSRMSGCRNAAFNLKRYWECVQKSRLKDPENCDIKCLTDRGPWHLWHDSHCAKCRKLQAKSVSSHWKAKHQGLSIRRTCINSCSAANALSAADKSFIKLQWQWQQPHFQAATLVGVWEVSLQDGRIGNGWYETCLKNSQPYLMMTRTCRKPRSDFQSRLSTLTQISPIFETFGWKILVKK